MHPNGTSSKNYWPIWQGVGSDIGRSSGALHIDFFAKMDQKYAEFVTITHKDKHILAGLTNILVKKKKLFPVHFFI